MRDLVVIEAPGKVSALRDALARLGMGGARVMATKGHLYSSPKGLLPIAIDAQLRETARTATAPEWLDRLRLAMCDADRVWIATDADQEGDVIAWDLASLVRSHPQIQRVRLRGLDTESVRQAFAAPQPVSEEAARPGTARRILDRLIGATLTDFDRGRAVGRVQTALLGLFARGLPVIGVRRLHLPCAQGGPDFVAEIAVTAATAGWATATFDPLPAVAVAGRERLPPPAPANYAETVLEVNERLAMPIEAVDTAMQRLYERGRMSYPRASARGASEDAVKCLQAFAASHGVRLDPDRIPRMGEQSAHSAPYPLDRKLPFHRPLGLLGPDDAVLAVVTRRQLRAGLMREVDRPDCRDLPSWARDLDWQRPRGVTVPWRDPAPAATWQAYPLDSMALRALAAADLGRPSTQVAHAARFAQRHLVDSLGRLTARGRDWLANSPTSLQDAATSNAMERCLETGGQVPSRVRAALDLLDPVTQGQVAGRMRDPALQQALPSRPARSESGRQAGGPAPAPATRNASHG